MDPLALLIVVFLTLIPALELRASIPWGVVAMQLPWHEVFIVAVVTNIILGPVIYFLLNRFVETVIRVEKLHSIYDYFVLRTRRRTEKYVRKYGLLGVALFVAVPLPGSGSYTGALAAYILGLGPKKFAIANAIGVVVAGVAVTAFTIGIFGLG